MFRDGVFTDNHTHNYQEDIYKNTQKTNCKQTGSNTETNTTYTQKLN